MEQYHQVSSFYHSRWNGASSFNSRISQLKLLLFAQLLNIYPYRLKVHFYSLSYTEKYHGEYNNHNPNQLFCLQKEKPQEDPLCST